jgi:hypothetical protein
LLKAALQKQAKHQSVAEQNVQQHQLQQEQIHSMSNEQVSTGVKLQNHCPTFMTNVMYTVCKTNECCEYQALHASIAALAELPAAYVTALCCDCCLLCINKQNPRHSRLASSGQVPTFAVCRVKALDNDCLSGLYFHGSYQGARHTT